MSAEEWRPVAGYEGLYEVSSLGRVRSLDRQIAYRGGHVALRRGATLADRTGSGYKTVLLYREGKSRSFKVARLVATAFIGPIPPKHDVDHRDRDKQNDSARNLRIATRSQNARNRLKPIQSGITGAHWNGRQAQFTSCITIHGKRHYLGTFETAESAGAAYAAAALQLQGEFRAPARPATDPPTERRILKYPLPPHLLPARSTSD